MRRYGPHKTQATRNLELFPISIAITLLFLLAVRGGLERGAFLAVALLPFGMTAFANLPAMGNLSLPATQVVAGCTIGLMVVMHFARTPRAAPRLFDPAARPLLLLGVYAVFSGTVLVRLFQYQLYVVPMNPSEEGIRISPLFASREALLEVNPSNISQMLYLVFSIAFFLLYRGVLSRRGTGYAHSALVTAATINLVLGTIDALQQDWLLEPLRTAKYTLLDTHIVAGMPRIIGGFPEASTFGSFSVTMMAYFAAHCLYSGERRSALLTLGCALASVASLSSTSYLGLAVATAGLLGGAVIAFLYRAVPPRHVVLLHVAVLTALALAGVYFIIGLPDLVTEVLDALIFGKADSSSGLERSAWAEIALYAFVDSHYLGVGVGSLRGNGLVSVYLGSVGVPGTVLLVLFLLRVLTRGFGKGASVRDAERAIANGAKLGIVTWLATALASATTPDPGPLAMLLCAVLASTAVATQAERKATVKHLPTVAASPIADAPASAELELAPAPFLDLGDAADTVSGVEQRADVSSPGPPQVQASDDGSDNAVSPVSRQATAHRRPSATGRQ